MGAWIETRRKTDNELFDCVAPRVGAWIETDEECFERFIKDVAPRVGAWIETFVLSLCGNAAKSHPVWVRGLKRCNTHKYDRYNMSHPVWVRGLKPQTSDSINRPCLVAPRVGAWIET